MDLKVSCFTDFASISATLYQSEDFFSFKTEAYGKDWVEPYVGPALIASDGEKK